MQLGKLKIKKKKCKTVLSFKSEKFIISKLRVSFSKLFVGCTKLKNIWNLKLGYRKKLGRELWLKRTSKLYNWGKCNFWSKLQDFISNF